MEQKYCLIHIVYLDDYTVVVRPGRSRANIICNTCKRKCYAEEMYKTCRTDARYYGSCRVCVRYGLVTNKKLRKLQDLQAMMNLFKNKLNKE